MSEGGKVFPFDKERVLEAVDLPRLAGMVCPELKTRGKVWWGPCPFHAERAASFKIEHRQGCWRFKCFGCAVGGNAIDFWMRVHEGVSFKEAVQQLGEWAGLVPVSEGVKLKVKVAEEEGRRRREEARARMIRDEEEERRHLMLPPLRRLSGDTMRELAGLRGVSVEGVRAAVEAGLVWGGLFGISERYWGGSHSKLVWGERMEHEESRGRLRVGPVRCWMACEGSVWDGRPGTAALRHGAAVRRLDGEEWRRFDGRGFKSWSVGSKSVPIGVYSMGERPYVMVVEGEGDLLAAYHFLVGGHLNEEGKMKNEEGGVAMGGARHDVENTAVVCVLGAASSVPAEVWPLFKGKRVRLFPDFDEVKGDRDGKKGKRAGWEWAGRLQGALREAGAEVDCFWLGTGDEEVEDGSADGAEGADGLVEGAKGCGVLYRADGVRVKDLGDAARGDGECLRVMEEECFGRLWRRRGGHAAAGRGIGEGVTGALTRFSWMRGHGGAVE